jgi:hypothetical protein
LRPTTTGPSPTCRPRGPDGTIAFGRENSLDNELPRIASAMT